MPQVKTKTLIKTSHATTVAASVMLATSTVALFLGWGMMVVATGYQLASQLQVRLALTGEERSYALSIESEEDFNQLANSEDWYIAEPRGPYVACLVPNPDRVEEFCAGREKCLRTPLFYKGEPPLEEIFGSIDFETWDQITSIYEGGWANPEKMNPDKIVYYYCAVHKIRQADNLYGFEYDPHEYYGQYVMPYDKVKQIHHALQLYFGLDRDGLRYYPATILHPTIERVDFSGVSRRIQTARTWADQSFIYYETLWLPKIKSLEEFMWLSPKDFTGTGDNSMKYELIVIVARRPQVTDYCAQMSVPCLEQTMFYSSFFNLYGHAPALITSYPEQTAGLSDDQFFNLFQKNGGIYWAVSLWQAPEESQWRFAVDSWGGLLESSDVTEVYQELKQNFIPGTDLVYTPSGEQVDYAREWADTEFKVDFGEGVVDTGYRAYNSGIAYGRLRVLTLATYNQLVKDGGISWQDFLVLEVEPFDVATPVSGTITGTQQRNPASHVRVRAQNRGTPNAYVKDLALLRNFNDKLVKVTIDPTTYTVEAATAKAAEEWLQERRPRLKSPRPINRTYRKLDRIVDLKNEEPTPRFSRFGGKASNLAKLYQFLPREQQLEALAIPFSYSYEFMEKNRISDNSKFPVQCRYPVGTTYAQFVQNVLANAEFRNNPAVRTPCLTEFNQYGRKYGTVNNEMVTALAWRIQQLWNDLNRDGKDDHTGRAIRLRFRSSSNMEDSLEFNGAGLYESRTVCMIDQFDADTTPTAPCDTAEDHEETIQHALRDVWMSAWLPRAFEEREYYQLPQDKTAMAILVNTGNPDEQSNGVGFTGNWAVDYVVSAQLGDTSVVQPEDGSIPERILFRVEEVWGDFLLSNTRRVQASSKVASGEQVLNDDQFIRLGKAMGNIKSKFGLDIGSYAPNSVVLDLEFKYIWDGSLIFKQVRPLLLSGPKKFTGIETVPLSPQGLTASEVAADYVMLTWQATTKPDDLIVIERRFWTQDTFKPLETLNNTARSFTDYGVIADTTYEYRVYVENGYGISAHSNTVSVIPKSLPIFLRGDANQDSQIDISDPVYILIYLFQSGPAPACLDAADANDDGLVDISDPIKILYYLYTTEVLELPLPGAITAGPDPTQDALDCQSNL